LRAVVSILLGLPAVCSAAEPVRAYVPFAYATTESWGTIGDYGYTRWETVIGVLNTAGTPGSVTLAGLYGNGAGMYCSSNVLVLAPHVGGNVAPCGARYPEPGVAMLVLETTPGVLVRAEVQKARFRCGCVSTQFDCSAFPQGQAYLPVYTKVFPAGSTAVSGPVELGNFDLPATCASKNQQYRRRVNVTLYNDGAVPATFRITETPNQLLSAPLYSEERIVEPHGVLQVNGIPVPTKSSPELRAANDGSRIWIQVSADQPFLFYVSTIFDEPEPGALPFQVYPGVLAE